MGSKKKDQHARRIAAQKRRQGQRVVEDARQLRLIQQKYVSEHGLAKGLTDCIPHMITVTGWGEERVLAAMEVLAERGNRWDVDEMEASGDMVRAGQYVIDVPKLREVLGGDESKVETAIRFAQLHPDLLED